MLKPDLRHQRLMAAMEEVDAAAARTRMVFLAGAAASLSAAAALLFGNLLTVTREGVEVELSTIGMLADGNLGGGILLAMSLSLLWPAYLGLMASVGMWQRRERLQWSGFASAGVLATIMVSSWRWVSEANRAGDDWQVGCALIILTVSLVAQLGFWRAGLWLLDSPYRD